MFRKILFPGTLLSFCLLFAGCGGEKKISLHYDSGELKSEWTINGAGEKHGFEKQYHVTGETKGLIKWVEGQMDSTATYYWKNGNPRKTVEYDMGEVTGTTTWFHENGNKKKSEQYHAGKKNGESWEYYKDGSKKSQITYTDGYRDGESSNWFGNGQEKLKVIYINGRIEGEYLEYHETGKPHLQGTMVAGKKAGMWREFDEEGHEVIEMVYQNDLLNGAFTLYFPQSGKVKAIGEFRNGQLSGQVLIFNEGGRKVKTQFWQDGSSTDGTNDLSWFPRGISIKAEELTGS
jgi:antitoxin component YwqK of YwqJK toxin-antitoxin module